MKTVVLLLGPSSAGKSTTCDALQNGYGWRVCSIDEECEKASKERLAYFENTLKSEKLFDELSPFMSREDVLNLCVNGILHIKNGEQKPYDCRFPNPDFPALEEELKKAGFGEQEIEMLTPRLRSVGAIYNKWVYPNLEDRLYKNAYGLSGSTDESVVIDMVPLNTPEETAKMLDDFQKRTEEYKLQYGDDSIQTFVVLAYCPPAKLSDRIKQRNINAERDNNPSNIRSESLPPRQFGSMYDISHNELMRDSYNHRKNKLSLAYGAGDHLKGKLQFAVATRAARDAARFSTTFKPSETEHNALPSVKKEIKHDAIIDTSVGSPDELAHKVLNVTGSEKQTSRHKP